MAGEGIVTRDGEIRDRSKKPEGPADDCQNPEANTVHRGMRFWLLASGFCLLMYS
jgi:hypothetical protein